MTSSPAATSRRTPLRGRPAEPRGGDAVGLPPGRGVSEHRGQEEVAVQPVHGRGRAGDHGRRTGDGAQQRDLPYTLATVPARPRPNATTASAPLKASAAARIGPPSRCPTRTALTVAASTAPTPKANSR